MLVLRDVDKTFTDRGRAVPALMGIRLSIPERQFVCVVGPSGSGKSTLLRLMMGLTQPTRGHVLYQGEPVHDVNPQAMVNCSARAFSSRQTSKRVCWHAVSPPRARRRAHSTTDKVGLDGYEKRILGSCRAV
jgi:NitT/TauT family transport system ATP-binding protein